MRNRLVTLGLVAVVFTAACSQDENVDLVLTAGDRASQTDVADDTDDLSPTPTSSGGVAIDRSALPTTPPGADGTTTTIASVAGGNDSSTADQSSSAATGATADDSNTAADGSSATGANPPPSASQPTLAPSDSIGWLWPSLTALATAWDSGRNTIEASPFAPFNPAAATSGTLTSGGQGFADRAAVPGGLLGGTIENDRDISSLLVIVPSNVDLPQALQSIWVTLDGTPAEVAIFDGMQKFSEFVADGIPAEGTQTWIASSAGTYSIVLTVVSGSLVASDTNAIEVAVIPVADQGLAQSMAQPLRVELLSLLN